MQNSFSTVYTAVSEKEKTVKNGLKWGGGGGRGTNGTKGVQENLQIKKNR
jgi:hypothetical protein